MSVEFENLGSLITIKGTNQYLGFLMDFGDRGVFEPNNGKVSISPEHAKAHNKALEEAMLEGLDKNCQIGQGGSFYLHKLTEPTTWTGGGVGDYEVRTFLGTKVSDQCYRVGRVVTWFRKGKTFRGRMSQQYDLFNFRRIK
jgi:hypothetical protein